MAHEAPIQDRLAARRKVIFACPDSELRNKRSKKDHVAAIPSHRHLQTSPRQLPRIAILAPLSIFHHTRVAPMIHLAHLIWWIGQWFATMVGSSTIRTVAKVNFILLHWIILQSSKMKSTLATILILLLPTLLADSILMVYEYTSPTARYYYDTFKIVLLAQPSRKLWQPNTGISERGSVGVKDWQYLLILRHSIHNY
jgi:hypothetical protein